MLDGDAALEGLSDGAAALENGQGAFGFLALSAGDPQMVLHADVRHLEDAFGGGDGALGFGPEFVGVTGYPTRFQRAGEGPS